MTTQKSTSWDSFLTRQLQDVSFAFGMLVEAAETPNDPAGYLLSMVQRVIRLHPKYTPVVISKYADLLSESDLNQLAAEFAEVKAFLNEYSLAFESLSDRAALITN